MDSETLETLKGVVDYCKLNPSALHTPSLAFFNRFLQSLGARVPSSDKSGKDSEDISDKDIVESNVEFDNSEVVEPDNEPPQKDVETASVLKEGEIIEVYSASELKVKLDAASDTSRLAIIYFTARWCGPCQYISPVYSRLAKKHPKVVFLKVDINEALDAAAQWKISSIPIFFFVKEGKQIDKIDNELHKLVRAEKNSLEQKIAQHTG